MTENERIAELRQENKQLKKQLADMNEKYNACQEARKLEIGFNKQDKAQLKHQLAEKDEEFKDAEEHIDNLELQLREQYQLVDKKDNEIEKLQGKLKRAEKAMFEEVKEHLKTIVDLKQLRHEICEKIKTMLQEESERYKDGFYIEGPLRILLEKINQIEQGEE